MMMVPGVSGKTLLMPPAPLIGGSRAYCAEHGCPWRKRLRSHGLARYRRHWARKHA